MQGMPFGHECHFFIGCPADKDPPALLHLSLDPAVQYLKLPMSRKWSVLLPRARVVGFRPILLHGLRVR